MRLCIPVCVSFLTNIPLELKEDPYVLVGCGGYKDDSIHLFDNDGINIAQYNPYFSELSMIYWMAKNYDKIGNPEYVGIAHYRRCLQYTNWMLLPNAIICHAENYINSVYNNYCIYHVKSDIDYTILMIKNNFSLLIFSSFIAFLNQSYLFERNLFIMPKSIFAEYSDFICKCIDIYIKDLFLNSDIAYRDKYLKRAFSFLCERLTSFWMYSHFTSKRLPLILAPMTTFGIASPYLRP